MNEKALEALRVLLDEAESFSVSGVYFTEGCFGHKGPDLARAAIEAWQAEEVDRNTMREALLRATASLAAAISLLERGDKKAAPSDKMFDIMLDDYRKSLATARAALSARSLEVE